MRTKLVALALAGAMMIGCTKEKMLPALYEAEVACVNSSCLQDLATYRGGSTVPVPVSVAVYKAASERWPHSALVGAKFHNAKPRRDAPLRHGLPKGHVGGFLSDYDQDGKIDSFSIDDPWGGPGQWIYRSATFRTGMAGGGSGGHYDMAPDLAELRRRKVVWGKCWGLGGVGPRDGCGNDLFIVMTPELEITLNDLYAKAKR